MNINIETTIKILFCTLILTYVGVTIKVLDYSKKITNEDITNSSVKKGIVLRNETITNIKRNEQYSIIKKVVVDTNNNGIEDIEDVTIDGIEFTYPGPKKGSQIIYLQNDAFTSLLATENENGNFQIEKKPSDILNKKKFSKKVNEIENLDNEFNNILTQKSK